MTLNQQKYNCFNKSKYVVHSHNGVCNMHDNREECVASQKWYDSKPQGTPI